MMPATVAGLTLLDQMAPEPQPGAQELHARAARGRRAALAGRIAAIEVAAVVDALTPERMEAAGIEAPTNWCRCGHAGGDHDLGNWCLVCPRPEYTPDPRYPGMNAQARTRAGWDYFTSARDDAEAWEWAFARLVEPAP